MDKIPPQALEAIIVALPLTALALVGDSSDLVGAATAGGEGALAFYAANMLSGSGGSVAGSEMIVSAVTGALAGGWVYFKDSNVNAAMTTAVVAGGLAYVGSAFLLPAVNNWRAKK